MNKISKHNLAELRKCFEKHIVTHSNPEETIIGYHGLFLLQALEDIRDSAETSEDACDFIMYLYEKFDIEK